MTYKTGDRIYRTGDMPGRNEYLAAQYCPDCNGNGGWGRSGVDTTGEDWSHFVKCDRCYRGWVLCIGTRIEGLSSVCWKHRAHDGQWTPRHLTADGKVTICNAKIPKQPWKIVRLPKERPWGDKWDEYDEERFPLCKDCTLRIQTPVSVPFRKSDVEEEERPKEQTYQPFTQDDKQTAYIACPNCGRKVYLGKRYTVASDGEVSPAVSCDNYFDGGSRWCQFHAWIVLDGWSENE